MIAPVNLRQREPRNAGAGLFGFSPAGGGGAGTNINELSSFASSLTSSVVPQRAAGSSTPTFTRATTKYVTDFEGLLKQAISGEVCFTGARRVRNYCVATEALNGGSWTKSGLTVGTGVSDPEGGTTAFTLTRTGATGQIEQSVSGPNLTGVNSAWLRRRTGTGTVNLGAPNGSTPTDITSILTTSWKRFSVTGGNILYFWLNLAVDGDAVDIWHPQLEQVQGQSNQNPSEYVSVGVLSAPFHGANVDGVKYFDSQNGNTVASNVVTEATGAAINSGTAKFGSLPGVSGDYFSTPSSGSLTFSNDIDIRFYGVMSDWTPAAFTVLLAKWNSTLTNDWMLRFNNTGKLTFTMSPDGTAASGVAVTCDNDVTITDGTAGWVRVTRAKTTGTVTFYQSTDGGATWTQLGATKILSATNALTNTAAVVEIGSNNAGTGSLLTGRAARAQIYNGIAGTLAVDFNPNTFASGTTWTSTTGEVWTINGNAKVFGGSGTSSIAAPWNADGPFGYHAEGARTNICLQSQTLGTTWVATNSAVSADQYVAPDGTTTGDRITAAAGNTQHYIGQTGLTISASTAYTYSFYLRYVNNRWAASQLVFAGGVGSTNVATFDLLNGVVGSVTAGVTSTITATSTANVYRCTLTVTSAVGNTDAAVYLGLNNTTAASIETWNAAGTEIIGAWGGMLEAGAFASTYIPTTTVAVARNADVLFYPVTGNVVGTTGTAYTEITTRLSTINGTGIIGTSAGRPLTGLSNNVAIYDGAFQASTSAFTDSPTVPNKVAASWGSTSGSGASGGTVTALAGFDGDLNLGTELHIGGNPVAGGEIYGNIRNVKIWNTALSSLQLQAITT